MGNLQIATQTPDYVPLEPISELYQPTNNISDIGKQLVPIQNPNSTDNMNTDSNATIKQDPLRKLLAELTPLLVHTERRALQKKNLRNPAH
ncbi:26963_t:CDS:2 [Gigaspora margarita]|uniref:26963_t:CDS:1 n=1 Tax=Gigaspora margarita TaxID=4874 RepID=A0ABN7UW52_GIGMA|nr:26963_t:CDS:2 [Gigaspora margarita]